jgi:hypothetical protein
LSIHRTLSDPAGLGGGEARNHLAAHKHSKSYHHIVVQIGIGSHTHSLIVQRLYFLAVQGL